jgi:hypothetical protein
VQTSGSSSKNKMHPAGLQDHKELITAKAHAHFINGRIRKEDISAARRRSLDPQLKTKD